MDYFRFGKLLSSVFRKIAEGDSYSPHGLMFNIARSLWSNDELWRQAAKLFGEKKFYPAVAPFLSSKRLTKLMAPPVVEERKFEVPGIGEVVAFVGPESYYVSPYEKVDGAKHFYTLKFPEESKEVFPGFVQIGKRGNTTSEVVWIPPQRTDLSYSNLRGFKYEVPNSDLDNFSSSLKTISTVLKDFTKKVMDTEEKLRSDPEFAKMMREKPVRLEFHHVPPSIDPNIGDLSSFGPRIQRGIARLSYILELIGDQETLNFYHTHLLEEIANYAKSPELYKKMNQVLDQKLGILLPFYVKYLSNYGIIPSAAVFSLGYVDHRFGSLGLNPINIARFRPGPDSKISPVLFKLGLLSILSHEISHSLVSKDSSIYPPQNEILAELQSILTMLSIKSDLGLPMSTRERQLLSFGQEKRLLPAFVGTHGQSVPNLASKNPEAIRQMLHYVAGCAVENLDKTLGYQQKLRTEGLEYVSPSDKFRLLLERIFKRRAPLKND